MKKSIRLPQLLVVVVGSAVLVVGLTSCSASGSGSGSGSGASQAPPFPFSPQPSGNQTNDDFSS